MESLHVIDQELLGSMAVAQCTIFEPNGKITISEPLFICSHPQEESPLLNRIAIFLTSGGYASTTQDFLSDRRTTPYTEEDIMNIAAELFIDSEGHIVLRSPLTVLTINSYPSEHSKIFVFETDDRIKYQIAVTSCSEVQEGLVLLEHVQNLFLQRN
jgi:hypothetical protein